MPPRAYPSAEANPYEVSVGRQAVTKGNLLIWFLILFLGFYGSVAVAILTAEAATGQSEEDFQQARSEAEGAATAEGEEVVQLRELVNALNMMLDQTALKRDRAQFYFEHERRVYWWQLIVSYAFFFVVIFMVAFGVWLSWLQFRRAGALEADPAVKTLSSDIEISAEKIRVRTSLIGVLILGVAFAFALIFLIEAYHITYVNVSTPQVNEGGDQMSKTN